MSSLHNSRSLNHSSTITNWPWSSRRPGVQPASAISSQSSVDPANLHHATCSPPKNYVVLAAKPPAAGPGLFLPRHVFPSTPSPQHRLACASQKTLCPAFPTFNAPLRSCCASPLHTIGSLSSRPQMPTAARCLVRCLYKYCLLLLLACCCIFCCCMRGWSLHRST
jgi:hypothetical protein